MASANEWPARRAAFYTNKRGVRVWHDPTTGKFAPAGFVSIALLRRLWRGDTDGVMDFDTAVRRLRTSEPDLTPQATIDRILGPRPTKPMDGVYYDAGKRRIERMWRATSPDRRDFRLDATAHNNTPRPFARVPMEATRAWVANSRQPLLDGYTLDPVDGNGSRLRVLSVAPERSGDDYEQGDEIGFSGFAVDDTTGTYYRYTATTSDVDGDPYAAVTVTVTPGVAPPARLNESVMYAFPDIDGGEPYQWYVTGETSTGALTLARPNPVGYLPNIEATVAKDRVVSMSRLSFYDQGRSETRLASPALGWVAANPPMSDPSSELLNDSPLIAELVALAPGERVEAASVDFTKLPSTEVGRSGDFVNEQGQRLSLREVAQIIQSGDMGAVEEIAPVLSPLDSTARYPTVELTDFQRDELAFLMATRDDELATSVATYGVPDPAFRPYGVLNRNTFTVVDRDAVITDLEFAADMKVAESYSWDGGISGRSAARSLTALADKIRVAEVSPAPEDDTTSVSVPGAVIEWLRTEGVGRDVTVLSRLFDAERQPAGRGYRVTVDMTRAEAAELANYLNSVVGLTVAEGGIGAPQGTPLAAIRRTVDSLNASIAKLDGTDQQVVDALAIGESLRAMPDRIRDLIDRIRAVTGPIPNPPYRATPMVPGEIDDGAPMTDWEAEGIRRLKKLGMRPAALSMEDVDLWGELLDFSEFDDPSNVGPAGRMLVPNSRERQVVDLLKAGGLGDLYRKLPDYDTESRSFTRQDLTLRWDAPTARWIASRFGSRSANDQVVQGFSDDSPFDAMAAAGFAQPDRDTMFEGWLTAPNDPQIDALIVDRGGVDGGLDSDRANVALGQIGVWNLMGISGGRSRLRDGFLVLPAGSGYEVRVSLAGDDTYTVQRVFSRGGRDFPKGSVSGVYADQLGDVAYRAAMFRDGQFGSVEPDAPQTLDALVAQAGARPSMATYFPVVSDGEAWEGTAQTRALIAADYSRANPSEYVTIVDEYAGKGSVVLPRLKAGGRLSPFAPLESVGTGYWQGGTFREFSDADRRAATRLSDALFDTSFTTQTDMPPVAFTQGRGPTETVEMVDNGFVRYVPNSFRGNWSVHDSTDVLVGNLMSTPIYDPRTGEELGEQWVVRDRNGATFVGADGRRFTSPTVAANAFLAGDVIDQWDVEQERFRRDAYARHYSVTDEDAADLGADVTTQRRLAGETLLANPGSYGFVPEDATPEVIASAEQPLLSSTFAVDRPTGNRSPLTVLTARVSEPTEPLQLGDVATVTGYLRDDETGDLFRFDGELVAGSDSGDFPVRVTRGVDIDGDGQLEFIDRSPLRQFGDDSFDSRVDARVAEIAELGSGVGIALADGERNDGADSLTLDELLVVVEEATTADPSASLRSDLVRAQPMTPSRSYTADDIRASAAWYNRDRQDLDLSLLERGTPTVQVVAGTSPGQGRRQRLVVMVGVTLPDGTFALAGPPSSLYRTNVQRDESGRSGPAWRQEIGQRWAGEGVTIVTGEAVGGLDNPSVPVVVDGTPQPDDVDSVANGYLDALRRDPEVAQRAAAIMRVNRRMPYREALRQAAVDISGVQIDAALSFGRTLPTLREPERRPLRPGGNLRGTDLSGRDLRWVDFSRADMREANLRYVRFSAGKFRGTDFRGADLQSTNFDRARLEDANFAGTTLRSTRLRRGRLTGANFRGARLIGVDLRAANLTAADLTDTEFVNVRWDDDTIWPDGFTPPPSAQIDAVMAPNVFGDELVVPESGGVSELDMLSGSELAGTVGAMSSDDLRSLLLSGRLSPAAAGAVREELRLRSSEEQATSIMG